MSYASSQILNVSGVSPLTFQDEPLFRVAFPNTASFYAHTWMYVLRASRLYGGQLGYKFFSSELVAVIGHRNGYIYVTPIADTSKGFRLRKLCNELMKATGLRIVLKKLPPTFIASEISAEPYYDETTPLEDDSVPETMLRLDKLFIDEIGTLNPIAKRVARKVRTFVDRSKALTIIEDIRQVPLEALEQFLLHWPSKHDSYMPMVRFLCSQERVSHHYRTTVFIEGDNVKGLYIAEKMSLNDIGLYCGVTARNEPGITEWMDIYFFKQLYMEGCRTVYLGGAERQGIAHFCEKLLPYKPHYIMQAMLYKPIEPSSLEIKVELMTERQITPLSNIYRRAYNALDELGERWTKESAHKFISHFYRRQPDLIFIATLNDKIVGASMAAIQPWWDGNHLVEGEIFTDPDYRDKVIEKELLKKLLVTARDKYHVVAWDTLMPTVSEHPFGTYENIGFREIPHCKAISGDMSTLLARLGE